MRSPAIVLSLLLVLMGSSHILFGQKPPKKIVTSPCVEHPSQLISSLNQVTFTANPGPPTPKFRMLQITNPTNGAIQLGKLYMEGDDKIHFALQGIISVKGSGTQPLEDCSNKLLSPHQSCTLKVALQPGPAANLYALLRIPSSNSCPLDVALIETNGPQ